MKHYQYITKDKTNQEVEIWVCESCRKRNSNLILEGKWRLIGRQENSDRVCNECLRTEKQNTGGSGEGDAPSSATHDSAPKAPEAKD